MDVGSRPPIRPTGRARNRQTHAATGGHAARHAATCVGCKADGQEPTLWPHPGTSDTGEAPATAWSVALCGGHTAVYICHDSGQTLTFLVRNLVTTEVTPTEHTEQTPPGTAAEGSTLPPGAPHRSLWGLSGHPTLSLQTRGTEQVGVKAEPRLGGLDCVLRPRAARRPLGQDRTPRGKDNEP